MTGIELMVDVIHTVAIVFLIAWNIQLGRAR